MIQGLNVLDPRATTGTLLTATAASTSWLDIAEPVVTIAVTALVGAVTLWYTIERALKLRRERVDNESDKPS